LFCLAESAPAFDVLSVFWLFPPLPLAAPEVLAGAPVLPPAPEFLVFEPLFAPLFPAFAPALPVAEAEGAEVDETAAGVEAALPPLPPLPPLPIAVAVAVADPDAADETESGADVRAVDVAAAELEEAVPPLLLLLFERGVLGGSWPSSVTKN
jgi:hypothetical protein